MRSKKSKKIAKFRNMILSYIFLLVPPLTVLLTKPGNMGMK